VGRVVPLTESMADVIAEPARSETSPWMRTEVKNGFTRLRERLSLSDQMIVTLRIGRRMSWEAIVQVVEEDGHVLSKEEADDGPPRSASSSSASSSGSGSSRSRRASSRRREPVARDLPGSRCSFPRPRELERGIGRGKLGPSWLSGPRRGDNRLLSVRSARGGTTFATPPCN
jgi:hypothetical protein